MGFPRFSKKGSKKGSFLSPNQKKHGKFFKCQNQIPERWFQIFQMFHLDHLWCANCNYMKSIQTLHKKWAHPSKLPYNIDLLLVWCPQSVLWLYYCCFMDPYSENTMPWLGKAGLFPIRFKKPYPQKYGLLTVEGSEIPRPTTGWMYKTL